MLVPDQAAHAVGHKHAGGHDIGDVVVLDNGRLCGILTDRDIVVRALAAGCDPNRTSVGEICSRALVTLAPDDSTGQSPGTLAEKLSRCKEGMARVFAVMVQILLSAGAIAVQVWSEPRIYFRLQIWLRALAQCRGTNCLGGSNLSRCRI